MLTLIGKITEVITAAEYANGVGGDSPALGEEFWCKRTKTLWKFLKYVGASASYTGKLCTVALGTNKSAFFCDLAAATDAVIGFAGIRPTTYLGVTVTQPAAGEYAWWQIAGPATFLHSGGEATVADDWIVTSASVAGKVEGRTTTVASLAAGFALCEAAKTLVDQEVAANIVRSVWGR